MQVAAEIDTASLASLGAEATRLLCAGEFALLAGRFGYALAYNRDPASAIQEDLNSCLLKMGSASLAPTREHPPVTVKYFEPNSTGLLGLVEAYAATETGAIVLVELVVTAKKSEKYVTLEQISAAA